MRLFGFEIGRVAQQEKALNYPDNRGGWWPIVREHYAGSWQRNDELSLEVCGTFFADWSCKTLIASDASKLRMKLVQEKGKVWEETKNPAYSPVLRKPNHFQNRIQFFETWVLSKLQRGNAYQLKRRDGRGVVTALYPLNPDRVQPLVADDGQVFYRLSKDNLADVQNDDVIVPARDIIHDRFNCLFHPLVGISPLYAAVLACTQGINIQRSSAKLAANGVRPGGILTAPGRIDPDNAARVKEVWETQYSGAAGANRIAVLGDGMKFEALTMTGEEAQLIEQLRWTAEVVCSVYHVPPFMIGVGQEPSAGGVQDRTLRYYTQCLQAHLEAIELCLDEALGIGEGVTVNGATYGTEFDTENLLRMDSATQMEVLEKGRNYLTPNEGRQRLSLGPTEGGDVVLRQQQDFSLSALAKRDAREDPFAKGEPSTSPTEAVEEDEADKGLSEDETKFIAGAETREFLRAA